MHAPKYIILLVIDCLRADHLGCYGYSRNTSPTIDALAAEGVRFAGCYPQGVYTFQSHVSMLSSVHQASHKLSNGDVLGYDIKLISDYLKEAGYTTAGIVSNGMIAGDLGLGHHFDMYDDGLTLLTEQKAEFSRPAARTTKSLLSWLDKHPDDRHFVFLHFNDCHGPYTPPEPYRSMFLNDDLYTGDRTLPIAEGKKDVIIPRYAVEGRQDVDFYVAQYDAALRYIDDHISKIRAYLSDRAAPEDILFLITGDHGEGMGEHGYYFMHGKGFYEEFVRVPLIVSGGDLPRGAFVDSLVRHIDILPSVLDMVGVQDVSSYVQGKSFLNLARGEDLEWSVDIFGRNFISAYLRRGDWKYIKSRDYGLSRPKQGMKEVKRQIKLIVRRPNEELYNLRTDPGEQTNLAGSETEVLKQLRKELNELIHRYGELDLSQYRSTSGSTADEQQIHERLKALGYIE